jgi:hypothetical protein
MLNRQIRCVPTSRVYLVSPLSSLRSEGLYDGCGRGGGLSLYRLSLRSHYALASVVIELCGSGALVRRNHLGGL